MLCFDALCFDVVLCCVALWCCWVASCKDGGVRSLMMCLLGDQIIRKC
jgi:hypothetical protein